MRYSHIISLVYVSANHFCENPKGLYEQVKSWEDAKKIDQRKQYTLIAHLSFFLYFSSSLDPHCGFEVSGFKLQSRYYVHFRTNLLRKSMNLLTHPTPINFFSSLDPRCPSFSIVFISLSLSIDLLISIYRVQLLFVSHKNTDVISFLLSLSLSLSSSLSLSLSLPPSLSPSLSLHIYIYIYNVMLLHPSILWDDGSALRSWNWMWLMT